MGGEPTGRTPTAALSSLFTLVVAVAALALLTATLVFGGRFIAAFLSDVSGIGLWPSVGLLIVLGSGISLLVVLSRRTRAGWGERIETSLLGECIKGTCLVGGALFASAFAAFFLAGLGFALADAGRLPTSIGRSILELRRSGYPMAVSGVVWMLLSPGWVLPMLVAGALGRPHEMFRYAAFTVPAYLVLAAAGLFGVFVLGPA